MTQFNKNFKQRVVSIVTLFALFLALNASGALAWFWRTLDNLTSNGISNIEQSLYGYWYGTFGWGYWYGYWYGYWNSYDAGYYYDTPTTWLVAYDNPKVVTPSTISDVSTISWTINSAASVTITAVSQLQVATGVNVTLPAWVVITTTDWSKFNFSTLTWATNTSVSDLTDKTWTPVDFWVTGKSLKFSKPVKIEINVWTDSDVYPRVKHFWETTWWVDGLSTSASATCDSNWVATPALATSTPVTPPSSQIITLYTCKASTFAAVTSTTNNNNNNSSSSGWGGWVSKDSCPSGDTSGSYYDGKCSNGTTSTETPVVDTPAETTDVVTDDTYTTETSDDGKVTITKADGTKVVLSDINTSFAKAYIEKLAALGIINGYEDGTFKPENKASRAEYLKIVLRAMNIDYSDVDTSKLTFADVDKNSWIAKVVVKAAELNLIDTTNKNFRPNASISRAESMKMLLNAAGIETSENTVSDFSDVKGWAVKYVQKAKDLGIVNGQEINGKILFRPADNITRAEVSKIVVKTMELK